MGVSKRPGVMLNAFALAGALALAGPLARANGDRGSMPNPAPSPAPAPSSSPPPSNGGGVWGGAGDGEGNREGVDDTVRTDLDGGGGGARRSGGGGGEPNQNLGPQINIIGQDEAQDDAGTTTLPAQAAPSGGGQAPVWCLMQRQGPNGNREQTVVRCDNVGGVGPGWTPIASNLTFTAASGMRDSFNAGNPALVWCVMRRIGPDGNPEQTVIRCDDMGGAGPGWTPVASNLSFAAASGMRDSFNAGNPPTVWCVMQRDTPDVGPQQTVIRCDDMGGAGPGWRPVASNLPFAAASAMRDAFNASRSR